MWLVTVAVGSLFLSAAAEPGEKAQSKQREVKYQKVTEVIFGDTDVNALPDKPGGIELREPVRPSFTPFTRLRRDFDDEMRKSIDEVK
jgi:hypothetical protein